jgi:hypothetical protein
LLCSIVVEGASVFHGANRQVRVSASRLSLRAILSVAICLRDIVGQPTVSRASLRYPPGPLGQATAVCAGDIEWKLALKAGLPS